MSLAALFSRKRAEKDDRCKAEKQGFIIRTGLILGDGPHDFGWCLGRVKGAEYWKEITPHVPPRFRRRSWPVLTAPLGGLTVMTSYGGISYPQDFQSAWHVFKVSGVGDPAATALFGYCQGFGGAVGQDHDDDDWILVNGSRERCGTMYRPTEEDLLARDWECIE